MPDNSGQVQEEYISKLSLLEQKINNETFVQNFSKNCDVLKSMCGIALVYENRMKQYAKEVRTILTDLKQAGGFRLDSTLIKGHCGCHCHGEDSEEDGIERNGRKTSTADVETQTDGLQSTDFIPPEGSRLTVADMVTQAAQDACPGGANGDYVYNEQYHMYFSQSTGYYWDPKTKLFFLPTTGTYYKYDEETQGYAVVEPPSAAKEKRRRSRSRDRRRRRTRSRSRSRDRERKRRRSRSRQRHRSVSKTRRDKSRSKERRRKRSHSLDEGELLSEEGSIEMAILSEDEDTTNRHHQTYPPCIRFVVKKSQKLQVNSVQLLPFPGGILGAPLKSDLCVPDPGVGKRHCNIYYEAESQQYKLEQLDGTNPTKVNARLLRKGDKHDLVHMDRFEFGDETLLEAHVHDNGDTCGNCEPGLLQRRAEEDAAASGSVSKTVSSEAQRRKNLKGMKKHFGLVDEAYTEPRVDTQNYADRAGERRTKVGSDFPHERDAAPADIHTPVEQTNRGFKMLQGMGWKEGEGLGRAKQGDVEPVAVQVRNERAGLGNEESLRSDEKGERWRKARARYGNIK